MNKRTWQSVWMERVFYFLLIGVVTAIVFFTPNPEMPDHVKKQIEAYEKSQAQSEPGSSDIKK